MKDFKYNFFEMIRIKYGFIVPKSIKYGLIGLIFSYVMFYFISILTASDIFALTVVLSTVICLCTGIIIEKFERK